MCCGTGIELATQSCCVPAAGADGVQQDAERGIAKRRHSSARGAAAMQLLLQEEEEAAAAAAPVVQEVPKPPSRLFRCLLRSKSLEAEVHVRLYTEYPLRPPLLLVKALREMPPATAAATAAAVAKGGGSSLKAAAALPGGAELEGSAVNGIAWMEQQVCSTGWGRSGQGDVGHGQANRDMCLAMPVLAWNFR
jgi:hypothetical protein